MIASASPDDFRHTIERVAAEADVDAVVAIFIPPLVTHAEDVAAAIRAAGAATAAAGTPLLAVFMAATDAELAELAGDGSVPVYGTPEEAARALGHVARYATWRRAGPDEPPSLPDVDPDTVAAVLAGALASGEEWLAPAGRRTGPGRIRHPARGVPLRGHGRRGGAPRRRARRTGGIKAVAPGLVHKADAGGVVLGVTGQAAATRAARAMAGAVRKAGHEPDGFIVQRMAPTGPELIVGIVGDPDFGPVVACGAGGHAVELLGDVAVRLAPLGPRAAGAMLRSLRTFPLLDGYRGAAPADLAAVEDVLLRVSALGAAHPEIAELDCNPLHAGPDGAVVLDARIRVAAPPPARPFPALDR